jgi:hypothetical protein
MSMSRHGGVDRPICRGDENIAWLHQIESRKQRKIVCRTAMACDCGACERRRDRRQRLDSIVKRASAVHRIDSMASGHIGEFCNARAA